MSLCLSLSLSTCLSLLYLPLYLWNIILSRRNCCLFMKYLVYGIWLYQPKWTKARCHARRWLRIKEDLFEDPEDGKFPGTRNTQCQGSKKRTISIWGVHKRRPKEVWHAWKVEKKERLEQDELGRLMEQIMLSSERYFKAFRFYSKL